MNTCEHCGSPTRMQVQAVISAPGELAHQLSKQNLRRKDVYLMGVLWETADFICTNEKCGRVRDGYGNYVTNLKKENDTLKERIKQLEELLEQAVIIIEPKKNKIVYRSARKAWVDQYRSLGLKEPSALTDATAEVMNKARELSRQQLDTYKEQERTGIDCIRPTRIG